jgi:hypothetical protein
MALNFGAIGPYITKFIINPLMWVILIVVFSIVFIGILWYRKKKRFLYPVAEVVDLGRGHGAINCDLKAGYFGKKSHLGGLWWTGEEVVKTNFGDIIADFSTEDFQEVNGQRGIVCFRDPLRRNILVPISKFRIEGKEMVANIAPSDYTDTAIDIIKDATNETSDWKDKLVQFAGWALLVVFSLVAIIVIVQMVKNGQDKSAELLIRAGTDGANACKDICTQAVGQAVSVIKGGSAP